MSPQILPLSLDTLNVLPPVHILSFLGNSRKRVSTACCDVGCFSQLNLAQALSSHSYMDFLWQILKILDITQIYKSFL